MLVHRIVSLLLMLQPVPSARLIVPDASVIRLDEIGLYRVGYRYRGGVETDMPYGWSGHFEDDTGVSCTPFGEQSGRKAFLLHCPWRKGTGIAYQEFLVALPRARRILLRGATAMKADIVGQSDGAVFRIFVNGSRLLETTQKDAQWRPFSLDLTRWRGTTVRLRFETDPGRADNPSFDYSLWGNRQLVLQGFVAPPVRRAPRPPLDLTRVAHGPNNVAPVSAYAGTRTVSVSNGRVKLHYSGADGTFEYLWDPTGPALGTFLLRYRASTGTSWDVPLATGNRMRWTAPASVESTSVQRVRPGIASVTKRVRVSTTHATLTIAAELIGKALVLHVRCDQPVIDLLDVGDWGPVLRRRVIHVPYYGSVAYLAREDLFANRYLDWTASAASRHDGGQAFYERRTDGTRNCLEETALFVAARHFVEVLPTIPNPPSPYLKDVGGRVVLDVWGGRYADIARKLEELHSYGIANCIVLIHDWQRSGYDNALPMHLPAAEDKGGDPDIKLLVATATRLGYRIALHENYVDYYPNYDFFDERHIALDSEGRRVLAWYNPGTKIQSFAIQPNAILPLAKTQSPEIHSRYGTNACYLDVHSAVPPWFHVDFRASEPGAGTFRQVFSAHRALWAYERQTHGGPVFGEGNTHWYWSGLLDGVEAQFGTGWPGGEGENAPLFPDFNLLKIHPLQINHGQGYYERWWKNMPWGAVPSMSHLDRYRLQEVVYGHIGFLGASAWDKVPYAWLEHHLITPVTSRHAAATVRSIDYFIGGTWRNSTEATVAGDWRRPRIVFSNGLTIIGNGSDEPWRVHGATLPPNGWIAHGAGVTAYTAIRDGVVVDYAETGTSVFANARAARDWMLTGVTPVRPTLTTFRQTGPRRFEVQYAWQVHGTPRADYVAFVHFSTPTRPWYDEGIRFQQDHPLTPPTSTWRPGSTIADGPFEVTIPEHVADGTYEWSIGLWAPGQARAIIEGPTDTSGRVVLGLLHITENGQNIRFEPHKDPFGKGTTVKQPALNDKDVVVTFPSIRTNGSVHVAVEGSEWVLRAMPRDRAFHVELNSARFGVPDTIRCVGGAEQTVRPVINGRWWRLTLNGASEYRWRAAGHQAWPDR